MWKLIDFKKEFNSHISDNLFLSPSDNFCDLLLPSSRVLTMFFFSPLFFAIVCKTSTNKHGKETRTFAYEMQSKLDTIS